MNKKAHRKIIPALLILLLSLAVVSTSTYAWFSMNTRVKGSGMAITTTAPTNMLISVNTSDWENGVTSETHVVGGFSPASTVDGQTFFALASSENIPVTGGIVDAGNRTSVQLAQVNRVSDANVYYAEFPLYVKAGEQTSLTEDLEMYLASMTVETAGSTDIANCVRVSVSSIDNGGVNTGVVTIQDDGTVKDSGDNVLTETAAIIYKYDTSTAVTPISAVAANVPTLAGSDPAIAAGTTTTCFTVDYTGATYTTVIVRIWLEGQHPDCLNDITGDTITVGLYWEASNYTA